MNATAAALIEELQAETPDALRLARIASLAVRVERHLLRRLRLELLPGSDTGIEADLWFSSIIESRGSGSFVINADAALLLRGDLARDSALFERAVAITEAEHRYLPESIQLEERLHADSARDGSDILARIDEALRPALRALRAGDARGKQVARWAMRALPRFDPVVRGSKNALALLLGASAQLGGRRIVQDRTSWPLSANDVAWAIPPALLAKHIRIGLELADDAIRFVEDNGKTPVIELPQTTPLLVELNWRSQDADVVYMVEAELGKWFQIDRGISALTVRTIDGRAYVVEKRFTSQSSIDISQTPGKPVCYVTMGMGVKTDYATGRKLDLDKSYHQCIKPVVEEKGFLCVRADEVRHSDAIDLPMYEQLLTADVVVADLSAGYPNAIYELGIRHGLRPHATIVIAEKKLSYPFDLNHSEVLPYEHLGDAIGYDEVMRFRKLLGERLDTAVKDQRPDSPVYSFIPKLRPPSTDPTANVDLPDQMRDGAKQCFVIKGFGVKTDYATGRKLDLDFSYRVLIKPVVEERGFTCVRADEIRHSGAIDVPMYQELLTADLVIADLSTANANALYELGIRHALRPRTTIVISENKLPYPFDLDHITMIAYQHLGDAIDYDEVTRFRKVLGERVDTAVKDQKPDSPVYSFLPKLRPPSADAVAEAFDAVAEALKQAHASAIQSDRTLPILIEQGERAIDDSRFSDAKNIFSLAVQLSHSISEKSGFTPSPHVDPYLIQRLALATYKAKQPDEISALNAALSLLTSKLNLSDSNDLETVGLAGAIEKRLFDRGQGLAHLNRAIGFYSRAYNLRNDRYNGINLAYLFNVRMDTPLDSTKDEQIADFLQANRIRGEVLLLCEQEKQEIRQREQRIISKSDEVKQDQEARDLEQKFWCLATEAEAHFGLGQFDEYEKTFAELQTTSHATWMLEVIQQQIERLGKLLEKHGDLVKPPWTRPTVVASQREV